MTNMKSFEDRLVDDHTSIYEGVLDLLMRKSIPDRVHTASSDSDFIALHRHFSKSNDKTGFHELLSKTPQSAYHKMAISGNVNDRMIAAEHAPHPILTKMVDDVNPHVKEKLAQHAPQFHEYMASDNAPSIRNVVAKNTSRHNVLHKLASDIDPRVATTAINRAREVLSGNALDDVEKTYKHAHPNGYNGDLFT